MHMGRFSLRFYCRYGAAAFLATLVLLPLSSRAQEVAGTETLAQNTTQSKKPSKPYGGGSPLDVILHNKFWETPPPAKPFVKESREPSHDLHYQSTAAVKDPNRPKPLNNGQLMSLESELEQAGAHNQQAAATPAPAPPPAKPAPKIKKHHVARAARGSASR
jgi:hypothetical protein